MFFLRHRPVESAPTPSHLDIRQRQGAGFPLGAGSPAGIGIPSSRNSPGLLTRRARTSRASGARHMFAFRFCHRQCEPPGLRSPLLPPRPSSQRVTTTTFDLVQGGKHRSAVCLQTSASPHAIAAPLAPAEGENMFLQRDLSAARGNRADWCAAASLRRPSSAQKLTHGPWRTTNPLRGGQRRGRACSEGSLRCLSDKAGCDLARLGAVAEATHNPSGHSALRKAPIQQPSARFPNPLDAAARSAPPNSPAIPARSPAVWLLGRGCCEPQPVCLSTAAGRPLGPGASAS